MQVDLVDAVGAASARPLSFASFTVPQMSGGAGYFAPLLDLTAEAETELNFALVPSHPATQAAGTTAAQIAHIDALRGARDWGICTECGMGRVAAEDVPTLLDLHRTIVAGQPAEA